jgi:MYXO-CTERM domain-containing protein
MMKKLGALVATSMGLLLLANVGQAQTDVTLGLANTSGQAGQIVDVPIVYTGPGTGCLVSFGVVYDPAVDADTVNNITPVFKEGSTTDLVCQVGSGFPSGIGIIATMTTNPDNQAIIAITVSGFDSTGNCSSQFGMSGNIGSCQFMINAGASPADYALPCDQSAGAASAADNMANELSASCQDGTLTVQAAPTDTPVPPTATETPVPPTPTVTNTKAPTNTPVPTSTSAPSSDNGGCQINTTSAGGSAWIFLFPAAALLWLRRRSR